jgi:uncharacterized protein (UPF0218 family)
MKMEVSILFYKYLSEREQASKQECLMQSSNESTRKFQMISYLKTINKAMKRRGREMANVECEEDIKILIIYVLLLLNAHVFVVYQLSLFSFYVLLICFARVIKNRICVRYCLFLYCEQIKILKRNQKTVLFAIKMK